MAHWPPAIGTKWRDSAANPLTRLVLWRDEKRVQFRSEWKIKDGSKAQHTRTARREEWERWEAVPVETFK